MAYAGKLFSLCPESFAEETLDRLIAGMVREAVIFLGRQTDKSRLPGQIEDPWGRWLIKEAIEDSSPYLAVSLTSRFPVIGIGAPAEIFVKRIAGLLQAPFILPDYAPVANAVGAVAGSVVVEKEAIIYARDNPGAAVYLVQIEGEYAEFVEEAQAEDYAEQTVLKLAREGAVSAGAIEPLVTIEKSTDGHLQRYAARGIGNPRL
jgi:N-methylhydantoinase A/oxoprolinase/acetone carboxylase beta subunit